MTNNEILDMMLKAGVRPSAQRIAVLGYVANGRTHPAADEIYKALSPQFPSLSLTTVYNSLKVLADAGLVKELQIEAANRRFDLAPQPHHSHFMCRKCGKIFDMPYPSSLDIDAGDGFEIDEVDVYLQGVCPKCRKA